jgi:hypothetical protein
MADPMEDIVAEAIDLAKTMTALEFIVTEMLRRPETALATVPPAGHG